MLNVGDVQIRVLLVVNLTAILIRFQVSKIGMRLQLADIL